MSAASLKLLEVRSRREWRAWLERHHQSEAEIWLVFHKDKSAQAPFTYEEAVEEALCFGWVDSLVKRLDDDRYARKLTPRKADSRWSTSNRKRWADLKARGLLAAPGLERAPTARSGDAPRPPLTAIPAYIEQQLRADGRAWNEFEQLPPSCRREYLGWIDSAKRQETKEKRLREAVEMLRAGKRLGLK